MSKRWWLVVSLFASGCFAPEYPTGIPCSENQTCPPGQTCGMDGICRALLLAPDAAVPPGTDASADAAVPADAAIDARVPDAASPPDAPAPRCGDGQVDVDTEVCDDGNTVSGDGCSADCRSNETCGNGILDTAKGEVCDDGNDSNDDTCTNACTLASCTDGFHNANELDVDCGGHCGPGSCNLGQMCGNDDDCATSLCSSGKCTDQTKLKLVFVSSELYTGNLGGLAGADARCQALADAAGLPGTYRAWLSSSTESPSSRFIQSSGPYALVNGRVIANSWADLTDGALASAINLTERGTAPPAATTGCGDSSTVWSGTEFSGAAIGTSISRCEDWTTTTGWSIWGNYELFSNSYWSSWCSGGSCGSLAPIYCFQQ